MQQVPNWIFIVNALAIPVIALIAAAIGFLQWRTAELKRKQDLYDKRYLFFEKIWKLYCRVYHDPNATPLFEDDLVEYEHEASFLFGDDIARHLTEVPKHQDSSVHEYEWFIRPFRKYLSLR
jgi:hypothetical protein